MSSTTACVSEGDFSFANGVFFAESSGRNKHPRATNEELRAHFAFGSETDHTAHWFEAQLMHYGLRPSKVKSVARMRLFDAIRGGTLSVPLHITELEQKLKEEWTNRDRDERRAAKAASSGAAEASVSRKRKAEVIVNVTVNTGSPAATASEPKRIRTLDLAADDSAPTPRFAMKQTARRGSGWRAPSVGNRREEPLHHRDRPRLLPPEPCAGRDEVAAGELRVVQNRRDDLRHPRLPILLREPSTWLDAAARMLHGVESHRHR